MVLVLLRLRFTTKIEGKRRRRNSTVIEIIVHRSVINRQLPSAFAESGSFTRALLSLRLLQLADFH
ncbi:hypothetical protein RZS08_61255, partial [Arthrospira platensis SPKY1]|nr:hypothetical protein [Arthrospira platensis SPKY1]